MTQHMAWIIAAAIVLTCTADFVCMVRRNLREQKREEHWRRAQELRRDWRGH